MLVASRDHLINPTRQGYQFSHVAVRRMLRRNCRTWLGRLRVKSGCRRGLPSAALARPVLLRYLTRLQRQRGSPVCAISGPEQAQQNQAANADYSITSSARVSSAGGTVIPSALAVLRLMTSSNLVAACTGRS